MNKVYQGEIDQYCQMVLVNKVQLKKNQALTVGFSNVDTTGDLDQGGGDKILIETNLKTSCPAGMDNSLEEDFL